MNPGNTLRRPRAVTGACALSVLLSSGAALARPDLFINGPFVTTPGGGAGGANLSAVQTTLQNITYGTSHQLSPANDRAADDFTLASSATISSVVIYAFQSNAPTTPSTFTSVNLRIWSGRPQDPGAVVIFGDTTTNRLTGASWTGCYRARDDAPTSTQRPIFAVEAAIDPPLNLSAGTYWLDFQASGSLSGGPFAVFVTLPGQAGAPGANARYKAGTNPDWIDIRDGNSLVRQEFAFIVRGTTGGGPAPCYANCDLSTSTPVLTANDFTCFLNSFATSGTYANCDQSTGTPLLTANDFTCFINRFALGCT